MPDGTFLKHCQTKSLQTTANNLRNEILNNYKDLPEIKWPPSLQELSNSKRKPPQSLYTFLEMLINQGNHHKVPPTNLARLVDSFAQDITSAVTRGKYIQQKHFLLGQGLHSTHFWVDNFDLKVERMGGGGSINTTHLMAFQEDQSHEINTNTITVPRKKSRKLFLEDINIETKPVDVKRQPENIKVGSLSHCQEKELMFNKVHFVWVYARKQNFFDQVIPTFKGRALNIRSDCQKTTIKKTVETFFPPFTSKVTEFSTIKKYLSYLQNLSASVNMPYVNITLDVGTAINAYKTVWSFPEQYKNVIIHLGGFHFLKENFQVWTLINYVNSF